MRIIRSRVLVYTLAVALNISGLAISGAVGAAGYEPDYLKDDGPTGGDMLGDLISRPMTLIATAAGAVIWVVTLPFTLLGGNTGEAGKRLIVEPAAYTFLRPLGHMKQGTPPTYRQEQAEQP